MAVKRELSADSKILTIRIRGRFDINVYDDLGETYKDIPGSVSKFVVDMTEVENVDSSALCMLLLLRERLGRDSAAIDIINCSPVVGNTLKTANFDKLFNIE